MPFTLVHPAAVLPLARSPLVPSALVAGAVAPDLTYYVPLTWIHGNLNLTLTHTPTSVLWLDPLIALVLLVGFQLVLRRPLVALLPPAAAGRVTPLGTPAWRGPVPLVWLAVSLALGSATHLAWDGINGAFGSGWSTRLDLLGDVVGGLVLLGWSALWWRRTTPQPLEPGQVLPPRTRWLTVLGVLGATAAWAGGHGIVVARQVAADFRVYGGGGPSVLLEYVARQAAIDVATGLGVTLAAYAVVWHLHRAVGGRA